MLKSHMDAVEEQLIATSKIPANSGHSLHKGTPREAFIKEFLQKHLPNALVNNRITSIFLNKKGVLSQ